MSFFQQRQERLSDCSALLEMERKVKYPSWRYSNCCWCCSFICLTTAAPAVCWHSLLSSPPTTWTTVCFTCFHSFFSTLLPPLSITSLWHQERRTLERRKAELEEELKVRRHSYHGHFSCVCLSSLALAWADLYCCGSMLFAYQQLLQLVILTHLISVLYAKTNCLINCQKFPLI